MLKTSNITKILATLLLVAMIAISLQPIVMAATSSGTKITPGEIENNVNYGTNNETKRTRERCWENNWFDKEYSSYCRCNLINCTRYQIYDGKCRGKSRIQKIINATSYRYSSSNGSDANSNYDIWIL